MKSRCLLGLLLLGTFTAKLWAVPKWDKLRLDIKPGIGTAGLHLNEVLPPSWPEVLGKPTIDFRYADTGEGYRHIIWGETVSGLLSKGLELRTVGSTPETTLIVDILIRGIRATVSGERLFIGLPVNRLTKRSQVVQKDDTTTYLLPGLILEAKQGKLSGLRVRSEAATRWRFSRWTIAAGRGVGPISLGMTPSDNLWSALGQPHHQTAAEASWSSNDGTQSLTLYFNPRSKAIERIRGVNLPWRTSAGVTAGDSLSKFLTQHPQAKSDLGRELNQTITKLPGLRTNFVDRHLTSFDIYPVAPISEP